MTEEFDWERRANDNLREAQATLERLKQGIPSEPLGRTRLDSLEEAVEQIKHDLAAIGIARRFVWLTPLDPQGQPLPQEAIAVRSIVAVVTGTPRLHPVPTFDEQTFTPGATIVLGHGWSINVQETPQEVLAACGE